MSRPVTNTGAELHFGALKLPPGSTVVDDSALQSARAVLVTGRHGPVSLFAYYESIGRLIVAPAADAAPVDPAPAPSAVSASEDSATDAPAAPDAPAPVRRFKRRG